VSSESRLAVLIFAGLVLALLIPFLVWRSHEANRPELIEARVVTATSSDPVLRDGHRRLAAGDDLRIAVVVRLRDHQLGERWLAPAEQLELDGRSIDDLLVGGWPEEDRQLRVFWFTIENAFVGGDLTSDSCAKKLDYRPYLAPEMGRSAVVEAVPEAHNDDHLSRREAVLPVDAGTLRFYARVELVSKMDDVKAQQAVSTLDASQIHNPALAMVSRSAAWPAPLHGAAGELFLLPGFEPEDEPAGSWNEVPRAATGHSFTELVEQRLLVSSRTFAATALTGTAEINDSDLHDLGAIEVGGSVLSRRSRPLRWQEEIRAGDVLRDGDRWIVALSDDGDGELDPEDAVLVCWRRPPAKLLLGDALGTESLRLGHLRVQPAPGGP
jgi:hypothetical protein